MEDLVRAKDEEIAKLSQIKEMLTQKFRDQKQVIENLEKQLEEAKNATPATPTPPDLRRQSMDLKMEIQDLMDDNIKSVKIPSIEDSLSRAPSIGLSREIAQSVANLASAVEGIGAKFETILGRLETIEKKIGTLQAGGVVSPPLGTESPQEAPNPRDQAQEVDTSPPLKTRKPSDIIRPRASQPASEETPAPVPEKPATPAGSRLRRPSDILKSQSEPSPEESGPASKPVSEEKPAAPAPSRPRRPSDILKGLGGDDAPKEDPAENGEAGPRATAEGIHSQKMMVDYPGDGVVKCPKCGLQEFNEMEDRSVVISYAPVKKYGRKFYCKKCRTEWAYKV